MIRNLIASLFMSTALAAQVDQSKRIELDLSDKDDIQLVSFENKKSVVLMYNEENADTKREKSIKYNAYDENLQITGSKSILINERLRNFADNITTTDAVFSFYYDRKSDEIVVIKFNVESREIVEKRFLYKAGINAVDEIKVIGNTIFMAMSAKRKIACLVLDFAKGTFVIHDIRKGDKKLMYHDLQLCTRPDGKAEVHLICWKKIKRRNLNLCYAVIDQNGVMSDKGLIELPQISKDIKRSDISLAKLRDGGYFAMGTYSVKRQLLTNGIYMSKISESGTVSFDKTYNFLDIPNFTEYLSDRSQKRVERKKARRERRGKELIINYQSIMHDIIEKDGKYLMICEFYYPTYRTEATTVCGDRGCRTVYNKVFDGYQYTHALVTSVDAQGKMLWSNIFELWSTYKPFYVRKFISVNDHGANVNLVFASRSYLHSKTFSDQGQLLADDKSEIIETDREDDVVKSTNGEIQHWYDQHFVWHGYQKIKNTKDNDGKRKRKVYFINKLSFVKK